MSARDRSRRRSGPSRHARVGPRTRDARWVLWPVIFLTTFAAYYPVWHSGLLWDDDAHLTRAGLQSLEGLRRIWLDVGATQQYYPVVHSAFWGDQESILIKVS